MRDHLGEIRAAGAELVIIGNGSEHFARAFRGEFELDCPLLVDPELRAYQAAGLRRGRLEMLSPRVALNAVRSMRAGARQTGVFGDPWQLGGSFVIHPGGDVRYQHVSREAGDHPELPGLLAGLAN